MDLLNNANMSGQALDCTGFVFPDFDLPTDVEIRVVALFQNAVFSGIANFRKVLFDSKAVFRGAIFSGEAHFEKNQLPRGTDFTQVRFQGRASFRDVAFSDDISFRGTEFSSEVDFLRARFAGFTDFEQARFNGEKALASFRLTTFGREVLFEGASFKGNANFEEVVFSGKVSFGAASFLKEADFSRASFAAEVYFGNTNFGGRVDFEASKFSEWVSFERADFRERAHFGRCRFRSATVFSQILIGDEINFEGAEFESDSFFEDLQVASGPVGGTTVRINFCKVNIRKMDGIRFVGLAHRLDLSRARFIFTDVALIRFLNVYWGNLTGWKVRLAAWLTNVDPGEVVRICDESFVRQAVDPGYLSGAERRGEIFLDYVHVAAVYKGLRESYERSLRYDEAGQFHIREMEMRRLAAGRRARTWFGFLLRRNLSVLSVYRLLSLYGESYRVASIWVLVAITGFAFVRLSLVGNWALTEVARATFDSIQAFLQLKSDASIDLAERVVGLILVALLGLALHRNFKR